MSLSTSPSQDKAKLTRLPMSPIRPVPALDAAPTDKPIDKPAGEQADKPTLPEAGAKETNAPKNQKPAPPAQTKETPAQDAPQASGKKMRWQDILLDSLLVIMIVGVLAGGGYYIKLQREQYRVPGIVEQVNNQCLELCKKRESLQDKANRADEQLHMRRRLAALENKLRQFSDEAAVRAAAISEQQNRVLALQHEIRRADKEARSVARGLLPGLYVGDVTTTRGKLYTEATISRLEGKRISIRTPYGAASLPTNELVKDNLPDLALYALGIIDLVDMRDFSADGSTTFAPASSKLRPQRQQQNTPDDKQAAGSYEPAPSGPVVDTTNQIFD